MRHLEHLHGHVVFFLAFLLVGQGLFQHVGTLVVCRFFFCQCLLPAVVETVLLCLACPRRLRCCVACAASLKAGLTPFQCGNLAVDFLQPRGVAHFERKAFGLKAFNLGLYAVKYGPHGAFCALRTFGLRLRHGIACKVLPVALKKGLLFGFGRIILGLRARHLGLCAVYHILFGVPHCSPRCCISASALGRLCAIEFSVGLFQLFLGQPCLLGQLGQHVFCPLNLVFVHQRLKIIVQGFLVFAILTRSLVQLCVIVGNDAVQLGHGLSPLVHRAFLVACGSHEQVYLGFLFCRPFDGLAFYLVNPFLRSYGSIRSTAENQQGTHHERYRP